MKKYVCLFGLCKASEIIIDDLADRNIRAFCILDNSEAKQGMSYNGVPVKKPEALMSLDETQTTVIIASRFYAGMVRQLREMGYNGEIIKAVDFNSFEDFSLESDVIAKKEARVNRGIDIINSIKQKKSDIYFVCPYNALGDVYDAMSFIPAYMKRHNLKTFEVVVTGGACKQVAEIFGCTAVTLEETQMDELVQAILYTRDKAFFVAHHDRPYTNHLTDILLKKLIVFQDLYKYGVFGLDKAAISATPSENKPYKGNGEIIPGKTIIIAPYAKSVSGVALSFWEDFARRKTADGFTVLTNTAGGEKPIDGTKPISIPISEFISASETAGHFVGIRSGLCDILKAAKCEKTVVFPDSFYSYTSIKVSEFFALYGWETIIIK
jgi:hypothetical protein